MRRLVRVERKKSASWAETLSTLTADGIWTTIRSYLGIGRRWRQPPITDADGLRQFLETRASFVAQTSLYGYVRTRAGMRYPELFDDDGFVVSLNVAKWQIWLSCLSDIAVHAGGRLAAGRVATEPEVGRLIQRLVAEILERTGIPQDAGPAFAESARVVQERIAACDWAAVGDAEVAFTESPPSLVRWAPIVDELKQLDEPIVLNSVRFRWQEVRRDLAQALDAAAVLGATAAPEAGAASPPVEPSPAVSR